MSQHRRRATRLSAIVAIPAIGALVLAGCSGSGGDSESSGGEVEFSLTYATSNNVESPYETLANQYMEANPNVTITLEPQPNDTYGDTIRTQLQAGNAPDVLQTEAGSGQTRSILPLAEAGFLEPLGETSASLIPASNEPLFTVDDGVYGQPLVLSYVGMIYNEVAADDSGITEFPTDWDGFEAACTDAAAAGKSMLVVAGSTVPNAGITALNVSATRVYAEDPDWNEQRMAGDVTFADSDGWRETLETIVALNDAGCLQAGAEGAGFDAITNNLSSGASVSFFGPLGSAAELQTAAPDQKFVAQAFPPAESSGKPFGIAGTSYSLSINADSEKKEAAQAFLEWLAEPENSNAFAEISGGLPISGLDGLDLSDTIYAGVADILQNGDFVPLPNTTWPNAAVYDSLASGVQGLLTGQKSVDDVLASLDTAWDQ